MSDDLATLRAWKADAENARHGLMTGQRIVEVMKNGSRVTYDKANAGDLQAYIDDLSRRIADFENASASSRPRRRFIPVGFG